VGIRTPPPRSIAPGHQQFQRIDINGNAFYVLRYGVNWHTAGGQYPLSFNVVSDLTPFNEQISQYRTTLWGWLIAMAVMLLVVQVVILVWGLRPLRQVESELSAIESGAQASVQGDYPREIARLTNNINGLLDHERAQQQRYRNALADLAHSLKTPLAVLRGTIGKHDGKTTPDSVIEEQVGRMDHIVAHQLQRAAMAGSSATRQSLNLQTIVTKIVRALEKVYNDKHLHCAVNIDEASKVRCDEGDLMELLGNVLDNAFKFAAGQVAITAQAQHDRLNISVEDDGVGIAEHQFAHILARGGRLDESIPGQGIGLSVVQDIVAAYQGRLQIDTSPTLGGARFRFDLPAGR
jgi:two-component system sensor histidine kinase PhoQ